MPQINKKKKMAKVAALGASALGASVLSVQTANADTIVAATEVGAGSDTITKSPNTPEAAVINLLNSQIKNLQNDSDGMVTIDPTPILTSTSSVEKTQAGITKLAGLIQQYKEAKDQLSKQNQTNLSLNGTLGADNTTDVTGKDITQTASNLEALVKQMQATIKTNDAQLDGLLQDTTQSDALAKDVIEKNKTISQSASDLKNIKNGVVGNMDVVNRKSQDSVNADGIVVDNSITQQVNTVNTTVSINPVRKLVKTLAESSSETKRILANLATQKDANIGESLRSDTYRGNAVYNIDDINVWLADMKAKAAAAKEEAKKLATAEKHMDDYKAWASSKLDQAMSDLKAKGASQDQIDKLQKQVDVLNGSTITKVAMPPVGQAEPYEFGDIGTDQVTSNGAQDDTIDNTKTVEKEKLEKAIEEGLKAVKESNEKAEKDISKGIEDNTKAIDKFADAVSKQGGTGAQVSPEWLATRQIYSSNRNSGQKAFYDDYVDTAIKQTSESISALADKIKSGGNVVIADGNPTVAQVAASAYEASGGQQGFSSVMLPDVNINNIISNISIGTNKGGIIYANSKSDGGAQAVLTALQHLPGYTNNNYSDNIPIIKDLRDQYIKAGGSDYTFTVVTNSPTLYVDMPDVFVYTDDNGQTQTTGITMGINAGTYTGGNIGAQISHNLPTASGSGALYVFNFQVNANTGSLMTGVGYIPVRGYTQGTIVGGGGPGAGMGEGASLNFTDGHVGEPIDMSSANGIGLSQTIQIHIWGNAGDTAANYAAHSPIFVSDIDDGQELLAVTSGSDAKIIASSSSSVVDRTSEWKGVWTPSGSQVYGIKANNNSSINGTEKRQTTIDSQSALVSYSNGAAAASGLKTGTVILRSKGASGNYMAIDTTLFAPFGIVGAPTLDLAPVNSEVKTLEVNDPTAQAHTEGKYNLSTIIEYLTSGHQKDVTLKDMSGAFDLPQYEAVPGDDMQVSSNTSMIVKQRDGIKKLLASGNSMTVSSRTNNDKTSSNNSFVVRGTGKTKTSSNNSLIVRSNETSTRTSSNNSFVVRTLQLISETQKAKKSVAPTVASNADGSKTVSFTAYVDPSMTTITKDAIALWQTALAKENVKLDVNYTSDVAKLKQGVTLAVLEANSANEQVGSEQKPNETDATMAGFGGMTNKVALSTLTADGENDIFNASGTVTAGDTLKNSGVVVQENLTELEANEGFKNALMNNKLSTYLLAHELGHAFGLRHDEDDSLMTSNVVSSTFTGKISDSDAKNAATNLTNKLGLA